MSQENVEIVRTAFGALARGEFDSFFACLDEDVEWVNPPYAVEPGTRRGTDGFREAMVRFRATWGNVRLQIDEVIEAGDDVVVVGSWTGEGTGSGVRMETGFSAAVTMRESRIARYEWFRAKAEALEALGLPE